MVFGALITAFFIALAGVMPYAVIDVLLPRWSVATYFMVRGMWASFHIRSPIPRCATLIWKVCIVHLTGNARIIGGLVGLRCGIALNVRPHLSCDAYHDRLRAVIRAPGLSAFMTLSAVFAGNPIGRPALSAVQDQHMSAKLMRTIAPWSVGVFVPRASSATLSALAMSS